MEECWKLVIEKYLLIKEIFLECEETDPELKTNLQPVNEFRAALDHVMKMMDAYYFKHNEQEAIKQYDKLLSHLDRAFFDICDLTSINYRNQILNIVSQYDTDTIRAALPDYFSAWKMQIEDISSRIARYRLQKGTLEASENIFQQYKEDVFTLRNIYRNILHQQPVLEKLAAENKAKITEKERSKYVAYISLFLAIVGIIISIIK